MFEETWFVLPGHRINIAQRGGIGQPLLLLHGLSARWQAFTPLIGDLVQFGPITAMDFRGHGKSDRTPGQYKIKDYVSDTASYFNREVREPVVVIGHSLGGMVGLQLAMMYPQKVRAVIVGDSPLSGSSKSKPNFVQVFRIWLDLLRIGMSVDDLSHSLGEVPFFDEKGNQSGYFRDLPGWDNAYLRYTAAYLQKVDPDVISAFVENRMEEDQDLIPSLQNVRCPVLLLQGNPSLGALMTDDDVKSALQLIPQASAVRINSTGHDLHLQHAEPVSRAIQLFLRSLE